MGIIPSSCRSLAVHLTDIFMKNKTAILDIVSRRGMLGTYPRLISNSINIVSENRIDVMLIENKVVI
jgi:hypothetical protein